MPMEYKKIGILIVLVAAYLYIAYNIPSVYGQTTASNWSIQSTGITGYVNNIYFIDNLNGFAVAGTNIIKTSDGGKTWEKYSTGSSYSLTDLSFINDIGWASASNNNLYKSDDKGVVWSKVIVSNPSGKLYNFNGIRFLNQTDGLVVGNYYSSSQYGLILKTTDGGTTWNVKSDNLKDTTFLSIRYVDKNTAYAIGYAYINYNYVPVIYKTEDAGDTWIQQSLPSVGNLRLKSFSILNKTSIIAVGDTGLILKTDDGTTWTKQTSGISYSLYSVQFINNETVFASGDSGTIIKSSDGGVTWKKESVTNLGYNIQTSIYFKSDARGWVGGYGNIAIFKDLSKVDSEAPIVSSYNFKSSETSAELLMTTNEASMCRYSETANTDYNNMKGTFTDTDKIHTASFSGLSSKIYKYYVRCMDTEGNINSADTILILKFNMPSNLVNILEAAQIEEEGNWTVVNTVYSEDITSMYFVDNNHGRAITSNGRVLYTNDKGNTWNSATIPITGTFSKIYFENSDIGWILGYDSSYKKYIYQTKDGGATWTKIYTQQSGTTIQDIQFMNSTLGFGSDSYSGSIIKTIDSGKTWTKLTNTDKLGGSIIFKFFDYNNGIVVSPFYNKILKTENSGDSWTNIKYDSSMSLYSLDIVNSTVIVGKSTDGKSFYLTNDSGTTWKNIPIETTFSMFSFNFVDSIIGFAKGSEGDYKVNYLYKTTDSGRTWIKHLIYENKTGQTNTYDPFDPYGQNTREIVYNLATVGSSNVWIYGTDGEILYHSVPEVFEEAVNLYDNTTVNLYTGWNVLSIPYKDFTISSTSCSIKLIYHYNSGDKSYYKLDSIADAIAGLGYWIYVDQDCSIGFNGQKKVLLSDLGDDFDGTLYKGWNQIGGRTDVIDLIEKKEDCSIKGIYVFDSKEKKYSQVSNIEAGKAYFVYSENDCYVGTDDVDNRKDSAVMVVFSEEKLSSGENKYLKKLKSEYKNVKITPISKIQELALSSDPLYIPDYDQDYINSQQNSEGSIITGQVTGENSENSVVTDVENIQQSADVKFVGRGEKFLDSIKKYPEKYKSQEFSASSLAASAGRSNMIVPKDGLIKDSKGNLYVIYKSGVDVELPIKWKDIYTGEYHTYYEMLHKETFAVAVSKDQGKTWTYLGKNYQGIESDLHKEDWIQGVVPAEDGVYVLYGVYDIKEYTEILGYGYAGYELRAVKFTENGAEPEYIVSGSTHGTIDGGPTYQSFLEDDALFFINHHGKKQYFVKRDKLFSSEDYGKTLKELGYSGYPITTENSISKARRLDYYLETPDGSTVGIARERSYLQHGSSYDYYDHSWGETLVKKGDFFEKVDQLDAQDNIGYGYSDQDYDMFTWPLEFSAKADSLGNIHILYRYTTLDTITRINYKFIPSSKITGEKPDYLSVEITTGDGCTSCTDLKNFLSKNSIAFSEKKEEGVQDPLTIIKKSSGEVQILGFEKLKVARELGIGFSESLENLSYFYSDSKETFVDLQLYLDEEEYPYAIISDNKALYKYFYGQDKWVNTELIRHDIKKSRVVMADSIQQNERELYFLIMTSKSKVSRNNNQNYIDNTFITENYKLYTTNTKQLTLTATASQLIPGTVFYIPIEDDESLIGQVSGTLSYYVSSQAMISYNGKKYYRVIIDLRNYMKAYNSNIQKRKIYGSLELSSGYVYLILDIENNPLRVSGNPEIGDLDISLEASKDSKGNWIVVNNLAIANVISCNTPIEIPANSYKVFDSKYAKLNKLDFCFSALQHDPVYAPDCDSWDAEKENMKEEIIASYDSGLSLYADDTKNSNYGSFFGTDNAKTLRTFSVDSYSKEPVLCKSGVSEKDTVVLEFNGDIFSEEYNPETEIIYPS